MPSSLGVQEAIPSRRVWVHSVTSLGLVPSASFSSCGTGSACRLLQGLSGARFRSPASLMVRSSGRGIAVRPQVVPRPPPGPRSSVPRPLPRPSSMRLPEGSQGKAGSGRPFVISSTLHAGAFCHFRNHLVILSHSQLGRVWVIAVRSGPLERRTGQAGVGQAVPVTPSLKGLPGSAASAVPRSQAGPVRSELLAGSPRLLPAPLAFPLSRGGMDTAQE